jgi:lipid II:glycine glycyltransferase (peptidoglycan interpeptide bridge formation enzyme)
LEWDAFVETQTEANFLHSWQWGVFNESMNKTIDRIGFVRNNRIIGVCLFVIERARRASYITVAGGPLLDWSDGEVTTYFFQYARDLAKTQGCSFVRIRPQVTDSPSIRGVFQAAGLRLSPMHLSADLTSQLALNTSEDELLAAMRKSTRYEVRKAQKLGLHVSATREAADIDEFYEVQLETAKRQQFVPFSRSFLQKQFEAFLDGDHVVLFRAYHEKKLLALAFVIYYGQEAVYHYGASTEAGRAYPGAYLIQWEAIREAIRRGCSRYNFWGVTAPGVNDRRFSSISLFKRGFGGEDVAYLPAHDLVVSPARYALNYMIESIRHRVRKL